MAWDSSGATDPQRVVALILHPAKRDAERVRELVADQVAGLGWPEPAVWTTTAAEPGGAQACKAVAAGVDRVLVGGGDGTVRQVARELVNTPVTLGIVPLGTGNLFARNLGIAPGRLGDAIATALAAGTRSVDVGVATMRGEHGATVTDEVFLVLAGIGHDAATVHRTRDWAKQRLGWLAYFEPAVRHAFRRPVPMTVEVDGGGSREHLVWSVLAGNCGRVPGGIVLFPEAALDDGMLDTMEVTVRFPWQWIPIGLKGLTGYRGDVPCLHHGTAKRMTVTATRPMPVQLDGDVYPDVTRLRVEVRPRALQVAASPS